MLHEIVLAKASRNERLADELLDQKGEGSAFGGAFGVGVGVGVDEGGDAVVPVQGEAALEVVGLLNIVVVQFGLGDLLPGVEILEVVVLEVVEDEFLVLGRRHEAGIWLLFLRLAAHQYITT